MTERTLRDEVAEFLASHPKASANEIASALRRRRSDVQALVRDLRGPDDVLAVREPAEAGTRYPQRPGAFGVAGVRFAATGVEFEDDVSFESWHLLGARLGDGHAAIQWALGDWSNWGEQRFGEKYAQAVDATGRSYRGLVGIAWVARSVPRHLRRETLSWSHHREIASLDVEEQAVWLDRAEANAWSVDELRACLREERDVSTWIPGGSGTETPSLTFDEAVLDIARGLRDEFGDDVTPELVERTVTGRLERKRREQEAAERRARALAAAPLTVDHDLRLGDFRNALDDLAGSVDAIVTDPPYGRDWIERDGSDFAAAAARLLKPDGTLVVLFGTIGHYRLKQLLDEELDHRTTCAYVMPGPRSHLWHARVGSGWKPVLIYRRRGASPPEFLPSNVFTSDASDKEFHEWGQSESGTCALVEAFSAPGDLVVDPFLGAGTTAVACRDLGRRFVGCDVDEAALAVAAARLAEEAA